MAKFFNSRLARKEEARNLRKTFIFLFLTAIFILGIIFFGLPSLVKVADFFTEIKSSSTESEKNDFLPPAPPKINTLPSATNTNPISISGFAEPGSTVEVYLNDSLLKQAVADENSHFLADDVNLTEGENEIYAVAQDQAGNKSQPSAKSMILFDKTPPELIINEPKDGASFNQDKQRNMKITGKTEPNITLSINGHLEVIDKEGNLNTTYLLSDGENILKFVAEDSAGNKTEKEIKVNFTF